MEALTGDEIHRLARLEAAQREAEADRQAAERARQQAVELREAQGLPEGGSPWRNCTSSGSATRAWRSGSGSAGSSSGSWLRPRRP